MKELTFSSEEGIGFERGRATLYTGKRLSEEMSEDLRENSKEAVFVYHMYKKLKGELENLTVAR